MTEITTKAKTVDQAIEKALYELGTSREQVEVKVLDVGSDGIMGRLGLRRARVRVIIRQDVRIRATRFLEGLLERMRLEAKVTARDSRDSLWLDIEVGGDGGLLIGHRGQTLQALQLLTERALGEEEPRGRRLVVDVNRYLRDREERLVQRAQSMAAKAVAEGRSVRTEPLPDVERRIVHHALRSDGRVETRSVGGGPLRPVVISAKQPGGKSSAQENRPRGDRRDDGPERGRRRPVGRRNRRTQGKQGRRSRSPR
jgi:spoIIIJ-associated protein